MIEATADKNRRSSKSEESAWSKINSSLNGVEKMGIGLAGFFGGTLVTDGDDIVNAAPEEVSIAGQEVNITSMLEEVDNQFDNLVWAKERNAENLLEEVTMRADKLGHYSVSYVGAGLTAKMVDSLTDEYDPKKVALGGMATVPIYVAAKEGLYEGPGMDINLESMDVRADIMMDTAGALHSTYNYHKKKTAEDGEEPKGLVRTAARKAGQVYGKASKKTKSMDILNSEQDNLRRDKSKGSLSTSYMPENRVEDREDLQNIIEETARNYENMGRNNVDELGYLAEKLLTKYGARPDKLEDSDRELDPTQIIENTVEDWNVENITQSLTAVANRYQFDYEEDEENTKTLNDAVSSYETPGQISP